ncbi:MBL fold metallo-hydrolase [Chromobacterium haemolyticum]|uniref:MBL fold metallo-hydrolase n=1 Tax=Chromobacterium fluminis TaxID=3044269 RepID=A0ABX0LB87_9NEIS|nr:MBL fold metallo-hydrolase [Chromobacterium haemolyticum]NHR08191.1 MBL fold metallo-hydrolase [Chromobacterium haemolyticum]
MRSLSLFGLVVILTVFPLCSGVVAAAEETGRPSAKTMKFQQIRSATIKLSYGGVNFLIDPMLAEKDAYPGLPGSYNSQLRFPRVELPMPADQVLDQVSAVILTHLHPDHWDDATRRRLPKSIPIFTQNEADAASVRRDGFMTVRVLTGDAEFQGVRLYRTGGQHGPDVLMASPLGQIMGEVSGIVLESPGYKTVYVAGDTVWTGAVEEAIRRHRPEVIILNTAYARMEGFAGSLIMGKEDLLRAHRMAPQATVIASHMETVNHAAQTRAELRNYIDQVGMNRRRVLVPLDGEAYTF